MWSGRGEKAECLLIEVREGEEKCIFAALHANKQTGVFAPTARVIHR